MGISTTYPSTGFLAGFLKHQQYLVKDFFRKILPEGQFFPSWDVYLKCETVKLDIPLILLYGVIPDDLKLTQEC